MHPSSIQLSSYPDSSWLRPDNSATHAKTFLPLLPSGPDGVQKPYVAQNPTFDATYRRSSWKREDL